MINNYTSENITELVPLIKIYETIWGEETERKIGTEEKVVPKFISYEIIID